MDNKCVNCKEHQEWLLENNDGSPQVICTHNTKGEEEEAEADDSGSRSSSSSTVPCSSRKRKFLSSHEFNERVDDKTKRRIAPIKKWRELHVGVVYRVCRIHDITVTLKDREQLSHYGEFADEHERLTNVWLTPKKFSLARSFFSRAHALEMINVRKYSIFKLCL